MSNEFYKKYGEEVVSRELVREFTAYKSDVDKDGRPKYVTEQSHKKMCDVNNIIRKYDKTGLLTHVSNMEYRFGAMSSMDFKQMNDQIAEFKSNVEALPSSIRKELGVTPMNVLKWFEDPKNRDRAIELGLISNLWTEETDGIGERIRSEAERVKKKDPEVTPEAESREIRRREA
jgi:hypothetical protein